MINRVISGGTDYLMKNLIRIMTDSVKLVEEPEMIDLHLDGQEAAEITQRWMKKYDKRLSAARIKGQDDFQEVFDEMRIKIIAELATPQFRKEVDRRLQAMLDRLSASEDLVKLEMVLLLKPLLGMKNVPWGLCGLIIAIYNRAMQQTIQAYEDEKNVYKAVVEAFESEGKEDFEVADVLKSPISLSKSVKSCSLQNLACVNALNNRYGICWMLSRENWQRAILSWIYSPKKSLPSYTHASGPNW